MQDNTHGYTDFHCETPSVGTGMDKPEVVKESYVVDYTTATRETLTMNEEGGFAYRWVYGLDRLSVKITSEGTNWWGQNVKQDILKDYTHQDRLGSTTNLTDKFGRVVGRADYNEWGETTYREALSITSSYRRIWPQSSYTGHDWDDVLGMYYAKARFYSAEDKRFVAMDPVKGSITDPMSLVAYVYCVDNPLRYVDPTGETALALEWAGKMWPLVGVDGPLPVGDVVYVAGLGICVLVEATGIAYFSTSIPLTRDDKIAELRPVIQGKAAPISISDEEYMVLLSCNRQRQEVNKQASTAGESLSGGPRNNNNDKKPSLQKLTKQFLDKLELNAHDIKYEYCGRNAPISHYDLAYDKLTGIIYIIDKLGRIVHKTYYNIHDYGG